MGIDPFDPLAVKIHKTLSNSFVANQVKGKGGFDPKNTQSPRPASRSVSLSQLTDVDIETASDNDVLTFDEDTGMWGPAGVSVAGLSDVDLTGLSDGDTLVWDAGLAAFVPGSGGGGGGPTIKDRRWTKATTDVSIDEFNGSSIDPAWTYAAHASIPALPSLARPRYVQDAGVLSVKYGSETGTGAGTADGGIGRHHAILRPLSGAGGSMAVGDAFYCAQTGFVRDTANHRIAGLVLSTSADSGAGQQLCVRWVNVGAECRVGGRTLSNWNGDTPVGGSDIKVFQGLLYIRIVKMTSTTWRWDTSADGVSWMLGSSIFTWAHEPTHVGFVESNWNTNTQSIVSYEFLRRQSGVL